MAKITGYMFLADRNNNCVNNIMIEEIKRLSSTITDMVPTSILQRDINQFDADVIETMMEESITDSKVIRSITYLVSRMIARNGTQKTNANNLEKASRIINSVITPWIRSKGGWKKYVSGNPAKKKVSTENQSNDRNSQPTGWLGKIITILTLLSQIGQTNMLQAFDCSKPILGKAYSLMEIEKCPESNPANLTIIEKKSYSVYQESDFWRTMAKECVVKKATLIMHCGMHSHTSIVKQEPFLPIIPTSSACSDAFTSGLLKISSSITMKAAKDRVIYQKIYTVGTIASDGSCTTGTVVMDGRATSGLVQVDDYMVELKEYQVTFDTTTGKMMSMPFCSADHTSCDTGNSQVIYHVNQQQCNLIHLKTDTFEEMKGYIYNAVEPGTDSKPIPKQDTPIVLMSTGAEANMRFIKGKSVTKCSEILFATNYPNIYVSPRVVEKAKPKPSKTDINTYIYFNNKIDFLYHHSLMSRARMYEETIANDCKLNKEILRTKLAVAITNPDIVAPLLPLENGVFGRIMGEVLYTYKCSVREVILRSTEDCTNELPVTLNGKPRFVQPITRLLIPENTIPKSIRCSNVMAPMYQLIENMWVTLPSKTTVANPGKLELTKLKREITFTPMEDIAKSGLYNPKDIEEARKYILFPLVRQRVLTEMAQTVMSHGGDRPDFDLLFTVDHYKKATLNTLKHMWGKFLVFGQMMSGFLGLFIIWKIIKMVMSQILSAYAIHAVKGTTWKLIFGVCPFAAKYIVANHHKQQRKALKREAPMVYGLAHDRVQKLRRTEKANYSTLPSISSLSQQRQNRHNNDDNAPGGQGLSIEGVRKYLRHKLPAIKPPSAYGSVRGDSGISSRYSKERNHTKESAPQWMSEAQAEEEWVVSEGLLRPGQLSQMAPRDRETFLIGIVDMTNAPPHIKRRMDELEARPRTPLEIVNSRAFGTWEPYPTMDLNQQRQSIELPPPMPIMTKSIIDYGKLQRLTKEKDSNVVTTEQSMDELQEKYEEIKCAIKEKTKHEENQSSSTVEKVNTLYPTIQLQENKTSKQNDDLTRFGVFPNPNNIISFIGPAVDMAYIQLEINGFNLLGLMDTGSPITVINARYLNQDQIKSSHPVVESFYTITGEKIKILGAVSAHIIVERNLVLIDLLIIENCFYDAIVGIKEIRQIQKFDPQWITRTQRRFENVIAMISSQDIDQSEQRTQPQAAEALDPIMDQEAHLQEEEVKRKQNIKEKEDIETEHLQFTNKEHQEKEDKEREHQQYYNKEHQNEDEKGNVEITKKKSQTQSSSYKIQCLPIRVYDSQHVDEAIKNDSDQKPECSRDNDNLYVQQQEWRRQNGIFKMIIGPTITTPRIKLMINETATVAFWDTGAPISLLHRKLLTPEQVILVRPMNEDYYSLSGHKLDINEKIRAVLVYQEQDICTQVCIIDHEVIQCVLGMDIISQLERRQVDWMRNDKTGEMRIVQSSKLTKEGHPPTRLRRGPTYEESAETTVIHPHQMPLIRHKVEINGNTMEGIMDTGCVITTVALRKLSSFQKWSMVPTNRRFRAITGKEVMYKWYVEDRSKYPRLCNHKSCICTHGLCSRLYNWIRRNSGT